MHEGCGHKEHSLFSKSDKRSLIDVNYTEADFAEIYEGKGLRAIYTKLYKAYNRLFFKTIVDNTTIKTDFEAFKDTSVFERYMLNTFQFSAAKDAATNSMMQSAVFDEKGERQGWSAFKNEAKQITDITNQTWLRTEYDLCVSSTVAGEQFRGMEADKDLYPYWRYVRTISRNPRDEHLKLVDLIFRIGDPNGDACFPPNGFNCGCSSEQVDDRMLRDDGLKAVSNEVAGKYLESDVTKEFRYNPAKQGPMPKDSSYSEVLPSANSLNYKSFGLPGNNGHDGDLTGLSSSRYTAAAKGLHAVLNIVSEWKEKYYTNNKGDIIFQNDTTLTNVVFNNHSLHEIGKHDRGIENLPETIMNCDELWMQWEDETSQLVVLRNYILFGKVSYIVQTRDGIIQDAFAVTRAAANKYRVGVVI